MTELRIDDPLAVLACLSILAAVLAAHAGAATRLRKDALVVDSEFHGGNLLVESIDGNTVRVRQDVRDTRGTWFWWHFRVRGAGGRTLKFVFTQGNVIGVRGPAVSLDKGRTWAWLG
ncbi:MAG: hypothetical protein ACODAJ_17070, partial [Planctomycetota bacterium]